MKNELIKEFIIPKEFQQAAGKFLKNCKTREDISIVSVTTTVIQRDSRCEKIRIALGAVAPVPIRIPEAESLLEGQEPSPLPAEVQSEIESILAAAEQRIAGARTQGAWGGEGGARH